MSDATTATTIAAALRLGRQRLTTSATPSPGLDAEVLLRHLLGIDRTALFARLRDSIATDALTAYGALLDERARGIPVAYLVGVREFMRLPFAVGSGVLVPRPETELLVEWALAWLRARPAAHVVDVGTGSGAIALSLAHEIGPAWHGRIVATDISSAAIAVAARNRAALGLERQVEIVQGSLLSWLDYPIDLVLANLPYLRPTQIAENPDLSAEPRLALDGGEDGLELIRALLADAPRVVAAGGALVLEIDPDQRNRVVNLALTAFPGAEIGVIRDLAGFDRHVTIQTRAK